MLAAGISAAEQEAMVRQQTMQMAIVKEKNRFFMVFLRSF